MLLTPAPVVPYVHSLPSSVSHNRYGSELATQATDKVVMVVGEVHSNASIDPVELHCLVWERARVLNPPHVHPVFRYLKRDPNRVAAVLRETDREMYKALFIISHKDDAGHRRMYLVKWAGLDPDGKPWPDSWTATPTYGLLEDYRLRSLPQACVTVNVMPYLDLLRQQRDKEIGGNPRAIG